VRWEREFERRTDALAQIFAFTAEVRQAHPCEAPVAFALDFVLEELFTNIVKYGRGELPVTIGLEPLPGGFEVTLDDPDATEFDPSKAPDADVTLPLSQREPGGLGLHLIRRMVDSMEYQYVAQTRSSRIRFRKSHHDEVR
jgi:serine/threonine-protein kinase RsbW